MDDILIYITWTLRSVYKKIELTAFSTLY